MIVKPCDRGDTPLGDLGALPTDGRPVAKYGTHDEAWLEVVGAIKEVVNELRDQPAHRSRRLR